MRKVLLFFLLYSVFVFDMSTAGLDEKMENDRKNVVSKPSANISKPKQAEDSNTVSGATHTVSEEEKSSDKKIQKDSSETFNKLEQKEKCLDTKKITFDFPNTELKIFTRFVAKLCEKILIGEDLLKGDINVKSQRNMDLDEVKKLLGAMLSIEGLEYIETENCMEIIPISDSYLKVYPLKFLKAEELAKALSQMFRMSFRVGNNPINIQITAIDGSNSLTVLAPKNQQLEIESSIKELDIEARQVLLEVLIIELSKEKSFGFGVNATFKDNGFEGKTGITSGVLDSPTIGYNYAKGNWNIAVNAADNTTKIKVLSQPRIISVENIKSQIKVSKKQPYANGSTSAQNGSSGKEGEGTSTTTTTTTADVGLDLTITPRINQEKDVILELKLDITSIVSSSDMPIGLNAAGNVVNQLIPVIGHRTVSNTSIVKNGKTLVIGGLLDNQKMLTTNAPPVLGDIPWLGFLFTKTTEKVIQTELLVYVTPIVIDSKEQLRSLTNNEIKKLQNYDPKEKETIDQILTGRKVETDDTFKLFDYFSKEKYREKQDFIPQP